METSRRAAAVLIIGAPLAPLITWWPMLSARFPGLGLPRYHAAEGIDLWSAQIFWLLATLVLSAYIWPRDRWLAAAVALAGTHIFFRGARLDPTHSILFCLAAVMLVAMRGTPAAWHPKIKTVLAGVGIFQLAYMIQQWAGYDLLWGPLVGGQLLPKLQPLGTLGTVDAASAMLAITAPLMPWYLLPFVGAVVGYAHSMGAVCALTAGLQVKVGLRYGWTSLQSLSLAVVAGLAVWHLMATKSWTTIGGRFAIWGFGAVDGLKHQPIVGYGLGGWAGRIPMLQVQEQFAPTGELWREAHNEPLQWAFEMGLIGVILLVGWLYTHRAMYRNPLWGGSLAALSVNSLTFFPLHVAQLALVAIILVGVATPSMTADHTTGDQAEWGAET